MDLNSAHDHVTKNCTITKMTTAEAMIVRANPMNTAQSQKKHVRVQHRIVCKSNLEIAAMINADHNGDLRLIISAEIILIIWCFSKEDIWARTVFLCCRILIIYWLSIEDVEECRGISEERKW